MTNTQDGYLRLLNALQQIEGIKARGSSFPLYEHEMPVNIYLTGTKKSLKTLLKIMDSRYGGTYITKHHTTFSEMCAELECIDAKPYFIIRLHSRDLVGQEADEAANRLATLIEDWLAEMA